MGPSDAKRHPAFACAVVLLCAAAAAEPGEVVRAVTASPETIAVEGVRKAVAPTVTVTGRTAAAGEAVRRCSGPSLNGVRLAEEMLTNQRVTIRFGSGCGEFRYDAGFAAHPGSPEALAKSVYYNKYRWDMFLPKGGGNVFDSNGYRFLWTSVNKRAVRTIYRFAFPEGIAIREISVDSSHRLSPDTNVTVTASRDPEGLQVLARAAADRSRPFPLALSGFSVPALYLSFSSEAPGGNGYGESIRIRGRLDASRAAKLLLKPGTNLLRYADDAASSHRAEVTVSWTDADAVADFEDPARIADWQGAEQAGGFPVGAASGAGCGRAAWEYRGNGAGTSLGRLRERNWERYRTLSLALDNPRPPAQMVLGFYDGGAAGTKPRFSVASFGLPETDGWETVSVDISRLQRSNVQYLRIYTGRGWADGARHVFHIDDVVLSESPIVKKEARDPATLAALLRKILPRKPTPVPETFARKPVPPVRDFFPIGAWAPGDAREIAAQAGADEYAVYEGVMDDFIRHNQNMIAWRGGGDREKLVRLAEAKGLRLYLQGPVFFSGSPDAAVRKRYWESLKNDAAGILPRFRGAWGLIGWEITEEIPPEMVADISPYYAMVNELDPEHPAVVIHNNFAASELDAKTNRPAVICHDIYPVLNRPDASIRSYYKSLLAKLRANADICGAAAWVLPQSYAEGTEIEGEVLLHRRHPTPAEMKWQAWSAVAHGCTGLILFAWSYPTPEEYARGLCTSLKTPTGDDTPAWKAWGEVSGVMAKLAPTLLRLRPADERFASAEAPLVDVRSFTGKDGRGRWAVVVNDDFRSPTAAGLSLRGAAEARDALTGRVLREKDLKGLVLPPGEGVLLRIGE